MLLPKMEIDAWMANLLPTTFVGLIVTELLSTKEIDSWIVNLLRSGV